MSWYFAALSNYFNFSGRARRKAFWYFWLWYIIIAFVLIVIEVYTGLYDDRHDRGPISSVYGLVLMIPTWSLMVRRLHDTGRSGWWVLFGMIPILGWITILVFVLRDSEPFTNSYGPSPKYPDTTTTPHLTGPLSHAPFLTTNDR